MNSINNKDTTWGRIQHYGDELWDRVRTRGGSFWNECRDQTTLPPFSLGEVAEILGVSGSYLRQLSIDGLGPKPELGTAGRRSYTLRQINELRNYLASARPKEALKFCPRRRPGEKQQIISVVAGIARTTTTFYLAQTLALQGFRVLVVDLDPRGSLSAMFGYISSLPLHNGSMYAPLRFDSDRASIRSVILPTNFDGLDLVPGSAELGLFGEECGRRYINEGYRYPDASLRMVDAFKEVEADYDVVVIRCGGSSFLNAGAFEAATGVLMTVQPHLTEIASMSMHLKCFSHTVSLIEKVGRSLNYDFIKFLVTRHDPHDVSEQEMVALLRSSLGKDLLTATVWESAAIREARRKKRSLYELSSGTVGRSAYEKAMETLNATNAEVMDIISEIWGRPPIYVSRASRSTTAGKTNSQSSRLTK
ncbi:plasmid partitioning protein RepA [Neorhizobium galegae]|uniref:plasmid partitioning protein RepA n=1 Tax=Neorhizobium galegae TaxID=399 RepID=UPI0006211BEB|nr:plasmid partitioning protein RepA [Neorhizobium galegae]CDZ64850.1 Plasmid partitioning protein RepA [Neorhizobium galegae bv. orientalis]MCQ1810889.1 plasmid partitioning protein RepA [Neorhizobium galegae]MCQ1839436.1 plasmid partitioning protein RepA [Neorhizobium galegae]CDZ68316.1 Plasmid partitioning protein RepA [Neorhizobium galegae bv. orientalis]